jgi:ferrochelatase
MRYGKPSLTAILKRLENAGIGEIIIFPMYPQYASSTTGSVVEKAIQLVQKWEVIPSIRIIAQYYSHPEFIRAYARQVRKYLSGDLGHIVISYHGLPVRQVDKVHPDVRCADCRCDLEMPDHGSYCYRATCYETSRLISAELKLDPGRVSTAFQSRLSRNWLAPFTDEIIGERADKGDKKILIMAPSFVTDCLETTIELGYEYRELFMEKGGEELVVVESLNDQDHWAQAIKRIIDGNH